MDKETIPLVSTKESNKATEDIVETPFICSSNAFTCDVLGGLIGGVIGKLVCPKGGVIIYLMFFGVGAVCSQSIREKYNFR